jgi:very-short-patch-repair endonuclease
MAAVQRGVVTRRQLLAAGLSRSAIDHRLRQLRLHPVHRGVYLVGHPVPAPLAMELAAVLACGEGAAMSHYWAAGVWGFRESQPGPIDVTVPERSNRSRPGIRLHRTACLDPQDVRWRECLPLTAPARTLVDLAEVLTLRELERAVEQAEILRLVRRRELAAALDRSPRRAGAATVRALLADDARPALTRSEAEKRLLGLVRAAELPPTAMNVRIGKHEADFLWRPQRLIVEVDGYRFHANRTAFERDRVRDSELQAAGYRVMRVTWRQIAERPEAVVARLAQALAR